MKLRKWEDLPYFMKTEEVRPYYEILKKHMIGLWVKRIFDFYVSTIMIVVLSPLFLVLALWIRLDSKGAVFYRQRRVTQYGQVFRIYKFRTMVEDADKIGNLVTVSGDSRITNVGKKLRGCRLDELPQLINIWKGEMTFVGTRPEVPKYVKKYTKEMYATLLLPAGVTSEASICFKDEERLLSGVEDVDVDKVYVSRILTEKMQINLYILNKFSFIMDLRTMFKTAISMICRCSEGAS